VAAGPPRPLMHTTIGLLTGQDRFPLMVSAFEGNRAETKTMLPARLCPGPQCRRDGFASVRAA
jgi:hypothetical protein